MLARSSRSERVESHPLRQQVKHSMSLKAETVECLLNLHDFSELVDCSQYGNMLGFPGENHCYQHSASILGDSHGC